MFSWHLKIFKWDDVTWLSYSPEYSNSSYNTKAYKIIEIYQMSITLRRIGTACWDKILKIFSRVRMYHRKGYAVEKVKHFKKRIFKNFFFDDL